MAVQLLGSINVDIIAAVEALPRAGETVLSRHVERMPGGKGANQAVAAARMGARTAMFAAVGADEPGMWMRACLAEAGVGCDAVHVREGMATGAAYIAVDVAGENQIIVASGANAAVEPGLLAPLSADVRVRLAQLEVPVEAVAAFFAEPGGVRMLNAAPALAEGAELFPMTDLLIVNQHELAHYLGLATAPGDAVGATVARALLARDDQCVVVTLGAGGAVAVWHDRHFHAPAFPVSPVDTIGAGDCFCGALAALIDGGAGVEEALPFANAAAALCTQRRGAIPAMPDRAAVDSFLRDGPTEHARAIKNGSPPDVRLTPISGDVRQ